MSDAEALQQFRDLPQRIVNVVDGGEYGQVLEYRQALDRRLDNGTEVSLG
jgi:hypothetical protein